MAMMPSSSDLGATKTASTKTKSNSTMTRVHGSMERHEGEV